MTFRACAVIPVFNHHAVLEHIVAALAARTLPVLLVDDGSDAVTKHTLKKLVAAHPGTECLSLPQNRGKGAAVLAGFEHMRQRGFTHALQVDADGQHDLDDVPAMLALAEQHPQQLISGLPQYDDSVPAVRFYGRYLTHVLIWLDTLSFSLRDTMCGFRVYPLDASLALARRVRIGRRMDFDTDIMTRLYWAGTESRFLPTRVRYPQDGVSHFRMFRDNARMTWLHIRLFLGMLPRSPKLVYRNIMRRRSSHWANIGERGSLFGLRLIGFIDRVVGRYISRAILYPVTLYFFVTHPRARHASREFLAAAGVAPTFRNGFRHFMQFSVSILDKVAAWYAPDRIRVECPDAQLLADAVAGGRGVLLLSAHLGNLELARALATLIPGLRINALVYSRNARKVSAMLEQTSENYRLRLIEVAEIGPDTAVMLRDKINAGEVVVIVGDRTPVTPDSPVVEAEFMGRPAPFAIGPYVLAHVLECPVYLMFCFQQDRHYNVHIEPFAERIELPRRARSQAAAVWVARYARRLAHFAARYPLQWYNFYDFWSGDPAVPIHKPGPRPEIKTDARHSNTPA